MEQKIYFSSFGGPSQNYYDALERICNQAKTMEIFTDIFKYDDKYLKNDSEFWEKHKKFIESNPKGYGFWLWKPYIILKSLEKIKNNDILLNLDAGCELNKQGIENFKVLIEKTNKNLIIGSEQGSDDTKWSKMDLKKYIGIDDKSILKKLHMSAGALMMVKCDKIVSLIKEWYDTACIYHFIDDSPSIEPNIGKFIGHRHDQSIFNLLVKKYGLYNTEMPTEVNINNPIWTNRNRTGVSTT